MARDTCIEITLKVPLSESVTLATALAVAQARTLELAAADDREVAGVAILADGRRLAIGEDRIREWVGI